MGGLRTRLTTHRGEAASETHTTAGRESAQSSCSALARTTLCLPRAGGQDGIHLVSQDGGAEAFEGLGRGSEIDLGLGGLPECQLAAARSDQCPRFGIVDARPWYQSAVAR